MRCITLALGLIASLAASAQNFPNRPIKLVVPYVAGGMPDTVARLIGEKMSKSIGQQMVIENRPGASSIIGSEIVVRAAPDGYTLLMADVNVVGINPHLFSKLSFDPLNDLAAVSLVGTSAIYLVAHPSVAANSMRELIALVKAHPGKLSYGSAGPGSIHHLATEALKVALGLDIVHVPYKGTGESVPALVGGQVELLYAAMPSIEGYVKGGKVKILAVSTLQRSSQTPDVPTVAESGVPGYDFVAQVGLYAPARTPPDVVGKLAVEAAKAVTLPDIVQRFKQLGIDPVGSTPESFTSINRASYMKYQKVVTDAGAKID